MPCCRPTREGIALPRVQPRAIERSGSVIRGLKLGLDGNWLVCCKPPPRREDTVAPEAPAPAEQGPCDRLGVLSAGSIQRRSDQHGRKLGGRQPGMFFE